MQGADRSSRFSGSRHAQTQNMRLHDTLRLQFARLSAAKRSCSGSDQPASAPLLCRTSLAHPQTRPHRATRPPFPGSLRRGAYLKLAEEFTWMLRPDGGLAFLFSLSAMPSRSYSSLAPLYGRPAETPEVRRCCDRVLPSKTMGKIATQLNSIMTK